MKKHIVGLALGSLLGGVHLVWSLLVAFGWAQPFLNWILSLHSLNNPYQVMPFNLGTSALLVVVTFIVGYIVGNIFTILWEHFSK